MKRIKEPATPITIGTTSGLVTMNISGPRMINGYWHRDFGRRKHLTDFTASSFFAYRAWPQIGRDTPASWLLPSLRLPVTCRRPRPVA